MINIITILAVFAKLHICCIFGKSAIFIRINSIWTGTESIGIFLFKEKKTMATTNLKSFPMRAHSFGTVHLTFVIHAFHCDDIGFIKMKGFFMR